jgi:excisionase family DNA binding protein
MGKVNGESQVGNVDSRDAAELEGLERCDEAPLLLKVDEVGKLLGLGRSRTYEMMASGQLPVVRIGTAVRVPRQRLLVWIEENTTKAA